MLVPRPVIKGTDKCVGTMELKDSYPPRSGQGHSTIRLYNDDELRVSMVTYHPRLNISERISPTVLFYGFSTKSAVSKAYQSAYVYLFWRSQPFTASPWTLTGKCAAKSEFQEPIYKQFKSLFQIIPFCPQNTRTRVALYSLPYLPSTGTQL